MSTYTRKPFISHDGLDEKSVRAEVKVLMGYGDIDSTELSTAGKSMKVSFKVENTKFLSSGWAPVDSNVSKKIEEAKELNVPVYFRIETRRQKNIDRITPIGELSSLANAKDNIHKSLAAVRINEDDEWTISPHAVTRLDEDPAAGGTYSAYDMTPEQREANSSGPQTPAPSGGSEPAPYITYGRNGAINPGSMAVAVPLNILSFVAEWNREQLDGILDEKKQIVLTKAILSAANELQKSIYDGNLKKPDLGAGSHTRARALLFETIRSNHPITNELFESKETLIAWRKQLVDRCLLMWKWSILEVENLLK
jgi:hypothetical protein